MSDSPAWTPPDDPDPTKIGQEARQDQSEGRYEVALAKRLWYHRHALEFEPHLSAVRLSFAIGYWHDLAKVYPPAMEAMLAEREAVREKLHSGSADFETFSEFVAFNRQLGENESTVEEFERLHVVEPATAKLLYRTAEDALVAARLYELCGAYLEPVKRLEFASHVYRLQRQFEEERSENPQGIQPPRTARNFYVRDVATMLALLSHNSRWEEAERFAEEALTVLDEDSESARAVFGRAVYGEFPPDR